jgi:hypothetical protein
MLHGHGMSGFSRARALKVSTTVKATSGGSTSVATPSISATSRSRIARTAGPWWSPSPPRMHVRPMDAEHQGLGAVVWLERDGVRAFEPIGVDRLPPGAVEELRAWAGENQPQIENEWLKDILAKGWLTVRARGVFINITVYPHLDTEIVREVDLTMCPCRVEDEDVAIDRGELVIGVGKADREQARLELRGLIWSGADDGGDAPLGGT